MIRVRVRNAIYFGRRAMSSARKPGVASEAEFTAWMRNNKVEDVAVVDARNTDFVLEPGDEKYGPGGVNNIAGCDGVSRPRSVNLPYDRIAKNMDLVPLEPLLTSGKDTPIVTHCGGGGRGQKAKVFLEENGFTNVINGGGPKETTLWNIFGTL